ncbi:MAG: hypothetical protein CHACPFDD_02948 [Phycisphaerae bacterium]|nr:hypothetical protein [Phycisphaerae bacterium]
MYRRSAMVLCAGICLAAGSGAWGQEPPDTMSLVAPCQFRPSLGGGTNASHMARIQDRCLYVIGTAADTVLALRLSAADPSFLEVDVDNDAQPEFAFDRGEFDRIVVNARDGDDEIWIDEINGVFTDSEATLIQGGCGDDTLFGGSGGETLMGGPGEDSAFLGDGDDRFIWEHGDGSDLIEGADGVDVVEVNGSGAGESFTVTANGTRVRLDRLNPGPFSLDIGTCEQLVLNAQGGDDSLACTGNLAALIQITADGGAGDDALLGSNGADVLMGGDDDDFIDGQQGNDTVLMGAGDDTFQWDPGDGNDTVEGQAGHDRVLFHGSNIGEVLDFSANAARLRFTRNIGSVVLDADGVEQFDLRTLGGADTVMVNDLSGTAMTQVNVDLAGTIGGSSGDGVDDSVNIVGTPDADTFDISSDGAFVRVEMAAEVRVRGYEAADQIVVDGVGGDLVNIHGSDEADAATITANGTQARVDVSGFSAAVGVSGSLTLAVHTHDGADMVSCTGNLAALVPITMDGGPGDDTLLGSNGADVLMGGDDDDFIDGQQGNDTVLMGAGDDTFQWDPGDGNDAVEGDAGVDAVTFNGSNIGEVLDFSANAARLRFTRNVGSVVLDADGVEQFDLRTLGGADVITINDLSGTALAGANINLAGTIGGGAGDAQPDGVIVNCTNDADEVVVANGISGTLVTGLSVLVQIAASEAAFDRLTVNGLDGDDDMQAAGLPSGVVGLTMNGGPGDDVLFGSAGSDQLNGDGDNDTIAGGGSDDIVQLGFGDDRFIWEHGDGSDLIEGADGVDVVEVNGSGAGESFTVTANGTRVRLDRLNPGPFSLDIGTCEQLVLNAQGGDDSLACTGNLAALIQITADGGAGDDALLGSNGADVLMGGDDDDFIDGQQGNDTVLMGAGDDTFQWDPGDGNDTVEGQAGHDRVLFHGSNIGEVLDFSANAARLRFTRNIGSVVLDADGVEQFDLRTLGGADTVMVNDLSGTAMTQVNVDLAGTIGGSSGDAQPDTIAVNGTPAPDSIDLTANAGAVDVTGLPASVRIMHSEAASDTLVINGLGGVDATTVGPGVTALIMLVVNQ